MNRAFLASAIEEFQKYKILGDRTLTQLTIDQLSWQPNTESNSIAIIVKHMHGNMLSRWTEPLQTDGEKEWRKRDSEFENSYSTKEQILEHWEKGWQCFFEALKSFEHIDLETIIYIRNEPHTLFQAINRQLAHYPSHVGQMMYIGKLVKGSDWQFLSIPPNGSQQFNDEMFAKSKA